MLIHTKRGGSLAGIIANLADTDKMLHISGITLGPTLYANVPFVKC